MVGDNGHVGGKGAIVREKSRVSDSAPGDADGYLSLTWARVDATTGGGDADQSCDRAVGQQITLAPQFLPDHVPGTH